jgi:hypothetical protein
VLDGMLCTSWRSEQGEGTEAVGERLLDGHVTEHQLRLAVPDLIEGVAVGPVPEGAGEERGGSLNRRVD